MLVLGSLLGREKIPSVESLPTPSPTQVTSEGAERRGRHGSSELWLSPSESPGMLSAGALAVVPFWGALEAYRAMRQGAPLVPVSWSMSLGVYLGAHI